MPSLTLWGKGRGCMLRLRQGWMEGARVGGWDCRISKKSTFTINGLLLIKGFLELLLNFVIYILTTCTYVNEGKIYLEII
jgi:hypothetical protein